MKRLHPRMHEFQWAHQDWVFSSWLLCHHFSVQQQDQQPYDSSYPFISRHRRTGQNSDNVMEWDSFFLNKTRDSSQDLVNGPLGSQRISVWNALWWLPDRPSFWQLKSLKPDTCFCGAIAIHWRLSLLASSSFGIYFSWNRISLDNFSFAPHPILLIQFFLYSLFIFLSSNFFVPWYQSRSCMLLDLHKAVPSGASYYKTCTK